MRKLFLLALSSSIVLNIFQVHILFSKVTTNTHLIRVPNNNNHPTKESTCTTIEALVSDFKSIGSEFGTDKISAHKYHHMYGLFLGPLRGKSLSVLEIGLGCMMGYGPGRSLPVWRKYLPNARLTVLEYDEKCAENFRSQVDQLFIGDQSDFKLLKNVAAGGPYDAIIDDGGHSRKQMINSLIGLWPALNPGGVYFVEDLYFWNSKRHYDADESCLDFIQKLIYMQMNLIDGRMQNPKNLTITNDLFSIFDSLMSVNCFYHACALVKKNTFLENIFL